MMTTVKMMMMMPTLEMPTTTMMMRTAMGMRSSACSDVFDVFRCVLAVSLDSS